MAKPRSQSISFEGGGGVEALKYICQSNAFNYNAEREGVVDGAKVCWGGVLRHILRAHAIVIQLAPL